jgi:predicted sulfurtransferase
MRNHVRATIFLHFFDMPSHDDLAHHDPPPPPPRRPHQAVVLFYRYFTELDNLSFGVERLQSFCQNLCDRLALRGRILLATEGINGTVSAADRATLDAFITAMEEYDYDDEEEEEPTTTTVESSKSGFHVRRRRPFSPIDWKISSTTMTTTKGGGGRDDDDGVDVPKNGIANMIEPFPDLKIRIVTEIISTGGSVSVHDLATHGGTHLSPQDFHEAIQNDPHQTILFIPHRKHRPLIPRP